MYRVSTWNSEDDSGECSYLVRVQVKEKHKYFHVSEAMRGNMGFVRTEELANQRNDDLRWVIRTYWVTCDK